MNVPLPVLRRTLERFRAAFPAAARLRHDPAQFPRRYADPLDRETAAFLAAMLAYGRVGSILPSVGRVLSVLGPRPARWIRSSTPARTARLLSGWTHRWTDGREIAYLVEGIRRIHREEGSLEAAFLQGGLPPAGDLRPGIARLVARLRAVDPAPVYGGSARRRASWERRIGYLLADPRGGSPLKRWSLFLRWTVREDDGVDLGLWRGVSPSRLVIPLDVHIQRVSRALGFTRLRTARWAMAEEVTAALRRVAPDDPLRYDFALCQMGISGACRGRFVEPVCGRCDLAGVCTLPGCVRPAAARASG